MFRKVLVVRGIDTDTL